MKQAIRPFRKIHSYSIRNYKDEIWKDKIASRDVS